MSLLIYVCASVYSPETRGKQKGLFSISLTFVLMISIFILLFSFVILFYCFFLGWHFTSARNGKLWVINPPSTYFLPVTPQRDDHSKIFFVIHHESCILGATYINVLIFCCACFLRCLATQHWEELPHKSHMKRRREPGPPVLSLRLPSKCIPATWSTTVMHDEWHIFSLENNMKASVAGSEF